MTRLTEAARLCEHVRERYGDLAAPAKFVAEALLLVIEEMQVQDDDARLSVWCCRDAPQMFQDVAARIAREQGFKQAEWVAFVPHPTKPPSYILALLSKAFIDMDGHKVYLEPFGKGELRVAFHPLQKEDGR